MFGVIFDLDGVIVDTEKVYERCFERFLRERGKVPSPDFYEKILGLAHCEVLQQYQTDYSLDGTVDELHDEFDAITTKELESMPFLPVFPGVPALLHALNRQNIPIALASNSIRSKVELILSKTGLQSYFQITVAGGEGLRPKPSPDVYRAAAVKIGGQPEFCVAIEDSLTGARSALSAGLFVLGYKPPGNELPLHRLAHRVITTFEGVTPEVLRHWFQHRTDQNQTWHPSIASHTAQSPGLAP